MKFKKIGNDVIISEKAEIVRPELVEIGSHVAIDMGVYISTAASIGDYIHIAPSVSIIGGKDSTLIMEDFTNIATGSRIIVRGDDFENGLTNPIVPKKYNKTIGGSFVMERFSVVGANSTVLPGLTMAEGSLLGANSLLTKDTEPWTIYVGSPAKPLRVRNKEIILKYVKEMGY